MDKFFVFVFLDQIFFLIIFFFFFFLRSSSSTSSFSTTKKATCRLINLTDVYSDDWGGGEYFLWSDLYELKYPFVCNHLNSSKIISPFFLGDTPPKIDPVAELLKQAQERREARKRGYGTIKKRNMDYRRFRRLELINEEGGFGGEEEEDVFYGNEKELKEMRDIYDQEDEEDENNINYNQNNLMYDEEEYDDDILAWTGNDQHGHDIEKGNTIKDVEKNTFGSSTDDGNVIASDILISNTPEQISPPQHRQENEQPPQLPQPPQQPQQRALSHEPAPTPTTYLHDPSPTNLTLNTSIDITIGWFAQWFEGQGGIPKLNDLHQPVDIYDKKEYLHKLNFYNADQFIKHWGVGMEFAAHFQGVLRVMKEGHYGFQLRATWRSELRINGKLIVYVDANVDDTNAVTIHLNRNIDYYVSVGK